MGVLACGGCGDGGAGARLIAAAPFLFYWLWAFLFWAIPVGVPLVIAAIAARTRLPLNPLLFLVGSLPAYIFLSVPFMGPIESVAPLCVILPWWLYRLAGTARLPAPAEGEAPPRVLVAAARINRLFLVVSVLLVPVAYARFNLQQTHPSALPDLLAAIGNPF